MASLIPSAERPAWQWPVLAVLAVVTVFGFPGLGGDAFDLWFQGLFWNGQAWLLTHENTVGLLLAYDGPKALIIIFAVGLLIVASLRSLKGRPARRLWYIFACMAVVTVASTQLRAVTRMATPLDLKIYGGAWEHLLLFQPKPVGYPSHAFPAGHASGGFAFLCLYWALPTTQRRLGLWVGLGLGSWMGLYQVARGEHFVSHTLATAALAWLVCVLLAWWLRPQADEAPRA